MTNYFLGSNLKYRQRTAYKNRIRQRDNFICQLCGEYGDQVDHIVPWAVSRDNSEGNLRVLCRACNLAVRRRRADSLLPLGDWYCQIEAELGKDCVEVHPTQTQRHAIQVLPSDGGASESGWGASYRCPRGIFLK